jgi:hypothetical protein
MIQYMQLPRQQCPECHCEIVARYGKKVEDRRQQEVYLIHPFDGSESPCSQSSKESIRFRIIIQEIKEFL